MSSPFKDFFSNLPIIGEFIGDTTSSLSRDQQNRYEQMRQNYLNQLGPNRDARMQALKQTMSLFQPLNDVLKRHGGTGFDFAKVLQDPMQDYDAAVERAAKSAEIDAVIDRYNENNTESRKMGGSAAARVRDDAPPLITELPPTGDPDIAKHIRYNKSTQKWERI